LSDREADFLRSMIAPKEDRHRGDDLLGPATFRDYPTRSIASAARVPSLSA
jgi:hypothetical protein